MTTDAQQTATPSRLIAEAPSPEIPAPRVPAQPDFARLGLDDPEGRN